MNWRNYVSCFEGEDKAGKRLLNRYLIISGVCVWVVLGHYSLLYRDSVCVCPWRFAFRTP